MAGSTGTVGKDTQSPEENLYKDLPFTNQTGMGFSLWSIVITLNHNINIMHPSLT